MRLLSTCLAIALAGCLTATPSTDPPALVSVSLDALKGLSLAPEPWPDHACAEGVGGPTAPLLPPFDEDAEAAVNAIARGIGIDLSDASSASATNGLGELTGYEAFGSNYTFHVRAADASPAAISLEWRHHDWPGWTDEESDAAGQRLLAELDPFGHVTWYVYGDAVRHVNANAGAEADGWIGGSLMSFRGYPEASLWIDPLQDISLPPKLSFREAQARAEPFLACAQPDARVVDELDQPWPLSARHGTQVWRVFAQAAEPGHHCGGPRWFVLVDAQTGDSLGIEDVLCY